MKIDKSLLSGSTSLLVLSLLRNGDKNGYEIKTYYSQTWMLPPAHLTLVTYDEIGVRRCDLGRRSAWSTEQRRTSLARNQNTPLSPFSTGACFCGRNGQARLVPTAPRRSGRQSAVPTVGG